MIVAVVIAFFSMAAFLLIFVKSGFSDKLAVKFGFCKKRPTRNWTAFSWESCLNKMNCQAQIVFFGDSLTRGGDFHKLCADKKLVNLGSTGDTLAGMLGRVSTVKMLNPKKVFLLGGINGLTDFNVPKSLSTYTDLLTALEKALPNAQIYVQSLLPLTSAKAKNMLCKNITIEAFNKQIRELAEKRGHTYIDLYTQYLRDGALAEELTVDGLHLKPEGYRYWYQSVQPYL